ncbi:hypothetical protein [Paraburkholderia sp. CNPSo 3281]|uniref:hypothetical protein n=1 Tax=Paraburkholderia sp. CNPSo 3281 TaxID=2940933 RepID=UPI0020B7F91C|nr:hypothetical protein [Paraburkholderia sp. CNPSo 3281]MCP3714890.1 hypothetical protein [Paraburkholderia sp. CNPSo 3281]
MRDILQRFAGLIASAASRAYAYVIPPEVEVRTEIDWRHPHRSIVSAPAGTLALVKELDDSLAVVDIFLEPVAAFAVTQYPQRTIRVRNPHDRDVKHGWHVVDPEPITESETFAEDIVAVAHVLPDGSAICNNIRYASIGEMLESRRGRILTEQ